MLLAVGIVIFILLIIVHEFGHFIVAKRNGIEVEEFGIGFPPRLLGKMIKGTLYSINLIPLGGFVKLKGESDADRRSGSFGAAAFSAKAKVLMAGVGMNILAAYALFLVVCLVGLPRLFEGQFTVASDERSKNIETLAVSVESGSAAETAGLKTGDVFIRIDGVEIKNSEDLYNFTRSRPDQKVQLTFKREDETKQTEVTLGKTTEGQGQLGVVPFTTSTVRYSWSAPIVAAVVTVQTLIATIGVFLGFVYTLISSGLAGAAEAPVTGPIGIVSLINSLDNLGLTGWLIVIMASISASLAAINALPIPALDGGRLAVISLFKLLRKPLKPNLESAIHGVGMALLLLLIVLTTVLDVRRFF